MYNHARSGNLRRRVYEASRSRGSPANLGVLKQVLIKRWQLARLLGWANFADFVTANKMIGTAAHADRFTRGVCLCYCLLLLPATYYCSLLLPASYYCLLLLRTLLPTHYSLLTTHD